MPDSFDFMQILTLLLIGLLFAKDTILPWIGEKIFGIERSSEDPHHEGHQDTDQGFRLEEKMDRLSLHFNHETTALLREISSNTEATKRKLEEFEKYGIPVRHHEK